MFKEGKTFISRLLIGIVLLAIALITIIPGGDITYVLTLIISLRGLFELLRVFKVEKTIVGICAYIFSLLYFGSLRFGDYLPYHWPDLFRLIVIVYIIVLFIILVFAYPRYRLGQLVAVFAGFFYAVVMISFIYQIRMLPLGAYIIWLLFICSWGSDTAAYCVGMSIGKNRLAPKISPKKSIEGAIGGVLGTILLGTLYGLALNHWTDIDVSVLVFAAVGGVGSIVSQVGDLAASALKRHYDIKDFGSIMPGHGGVLDRFDSMIFVAPLIYYVSVAFLL